MFWMQKTQYQNTQYTTTKHSSQTEPQEQDQVLGTDFASPIIYCNQNIGEKKAYILLFTSSLTREIYQIKPEVTS